MLVSVAQRLPPCPESEDFQAGSFLSESIHASSQTFQLSDKHTLCIRLFFTATPDVKVAFACHPIDSHHAVLVSGIQSEYQLTQGMKSGILSQFQLFSCHKLKSLMCFLHRSQESELYRFFVYMGRKSRIHHLKPLLQ